MSVSVTLPKMGESVVEGTIVRWLKGEGDTVAEDEPLVEISTDKIDTELPSPATGVLSKILVGPDQTVEVGTELAVIEENGKGAAAPAKPKKEVPAPAEPSKPAKPAPEPSREKPAPKPSEAPPAAAEPGAVTSPLVRKLARERGVDVAQVAGTGPGGRVTKEDVLAATGRPAATRAPSPPASIYAVPSAASEDVPFTRVRKAIAEHMVRSLQTAAQLTNVVEVDMTRVAHVRSRAKGAFEQAEGLSLTFLPFIASAAVQALRGLPEFNAHVTEDGQSARLFRQVNLGIAVGRDEGLIVPVIHGADGMNIVGLARAIADVANRARTKGGLKPDDLVGGTFTITNYGSAGALLDTPIISQPQVAILGTGTIQKRPAVITLDGADAIAIRQMMFLSLTYDHRWIDGHRAAQFNSRIRQILEEGDFGADLGLEPE